MRFLRLEEAVSAVNFRNQNYPVPGFTFTPSGMSAADVALLQKTLGVAILGELRSLLMQFNFGNLTLGFVSFATGSSNAEYLTESNPPGSWWSLLNANLILLAETDGFSVFVDGRQDTVYSAEAGTRHLDVISTSVVRFVEVLGTLCTVSRIEANDELVHSICSYCDCDAAVKFWRR